jgi:hypothetical protein
MAQTSEQFQRAIAAIDAANSLDPHSSLIDGRSIPNELLYSQRMTAWLNKLAPDASETLRLAARAQHIRRWDIPRSSFPMTRPGYHQWRTTLYAHHASIGAAILREAGYDPGAVARVSSLLKKENLKTDPDAQLLEDIACLVFLENYFADFARDKDEPKLLGIVNKTWKKMSPQAQQAARQLDLPPAASAILHKALEF